MDMKYKILSEMDERLRRLYRQAQNGGPDAQERYNQEVQRQLKYEFMIVVQTGTHYGRGTPPLLSDAFQRADSAWNVISTFGWKGFRFGQDEDAFFMADANPEFVLNIYHNSRRALYGSEEDYNFTMSDHQIQVRSGSPWPLEDASEIEIEVDGHLAYLLPKNEHNKHYYETSSPISGKENPIQIWWEGYGQYSDYPVDPDARRTIEDLDLDIGNYDGGVIEDLEESVMTARQRWLSG